MTSILKKAKRSYHLIHDGSTRLFIDELKKRTHSEIISLGLMRDITVPFELPKAKIPIKIRKLRASDVSVLLDEEDLITRNLKLYDYQKGLIEEFFPYCYVAEDPQGKACYMQFLLGADLNDKIRKHSDGIFPRLAADEALLEGAFMKLSTRGQRIMPAAMARIALRAKKMNAHKVLTFVDKDNIPSLKGCKRAGFSPYITRIDHWSFFQLHTEFEPINEQILHEYNERMGISAT